LTTFPAAKKEVDPGQSRRRLRVAGGIGAVLVLATVAKPIVHGMQAARIEYRALHPQRQSVELPPDAATLGLVAVHFPSSGGDEIAGWLLPGTTGAAVLLVHGSEADRRQMLPTARALAQVGIGSLLIDSPGAGESGGEVTFGPSERETVNAALQFLRSVPTTDSTRVGVYGFSAGAVAVLSVAGVSPVAAVAVAGCPTDLATATQHEYRGAGPVAQWSAATALRAAGVDVAAYRPIDVIERFGSTPILLISGERDVVVIPADTRALAARAQRAQWHVVPAMAHEEPATHSAVAGKLLVDFFQRTLR
jgi:dipeptidyl aminopeptidase/acylaminoacyl peptidase